MNISDRPRSCPFENAFSEIIINMESGNYDYVKQQLESGSLNPKCNFASHNLSFSSLTYMLGLASARHLDLKSALKIIELLKNYGAEWWDPELEIEDYCKEFSVYTSMLCSFGVDEIIDKTCTLRSRMHYLLKPIEYVEAMDKWALFIFSFKSKDYIIPKELLIKIFSNYVDNPQVYEKHWVKEVDIAIKSLKTEEILPVEDKKSIKQIMLNAIKSIKRYH